MTGEISRRNLTTESGDSEGTEVLSLPEEEILSAFETQGVYQLPKNARVHITVKIADKKEPVDLGTMQIAEPLVTRILEAWELDASTKKPEEIDQLAPSSPLT